MSFPETRNLSREEAEDLLEAVRSAGGKGQISEAYVEGRYLLGVQYLPDVGRFVRAAVALGITDPLVYTAGRGWHLGVPE